MLRLARHSSSIGHMHSERGRSIRIIWSYLRDWPSLHIYQVWDGKVHGTEYGEHSRRDCFQLSFDILQEPSITCQSIPIWLYPKTPEPVFLSPSSMYAYHASLLAAISRRYRSCDPFKIHKKAQLLGWRCHKLGHCSLGNHLHCWTHRRQERRKSCRRLDTPLLKSC